VSLSPLISLFIDIAVYLYPFSKLLFGSIPTNSADLTPLKSIGLGHGATYYSHRPCTIFEGPE